MAVSVLHPISPAIERTRVMLFQPFDAEKWITLGFGAWLAYLGEGGGSWSGGFNWSGGGTGGPGEPALEPALQWIEDHLNFLVVSALVAVVVMFLLGLVLTWLKSRGQFLLLSAMARNRAEVVRPWREYHAEANSLFWFRAFVSLCGWVATVGLVAGCAVIAWPDFQLRRFGTDAITALWIGIPSCVVMGLLFGLVNLFLIHFVVPIMYLRRLGVLAAWGEFHTSMFSGHSATFVLYVLFQILIVTAVGTMACMVTCMTCCIASVPYVGTVILLPLILFQRCYQVCFLEQFGPEWEFFHWYRPEDPATGSGAARDGWQEI